MSKKQLIMTKGLPGSGKSTWAAGQVLEALKTGERVEVVNKDDIRKELSEGGWLWSPKKEQDVIDIRDDTIAKALSSGKSVISSDTNFGSRHETRLQDLAKLYGAEFIVMDFSKVPLETCVDRDSKRPKDKRVGQKVIYDMYEQYVQKIELYNADFDLAPAIICDLDGTLALCEGLRNVYDCAKCASDDVNDPIYRLIWAMHNANHWIIYMSGRDAKFRPQTLEFLQKHECPPGPLFMRPEGDKRKDSLVKLELFDNHVRNSYNVRLAIDDRDQVVRMWRKLGLTCLQCADGNF